MRLRTWILLAVALLMAGTYAWAPYLPRLVREGFPPPVWPAEGAFAEVTGTHASEPAPAARSDPAGFDAQLRELLEQHTTRAFLAARNGRIEIEHYGNGTHRDTLLNSYSLVKSLVGALILKAVAEKRITGLDAPIGPYLPDLGDQSLRAVPIRALLEMRSGILLETGHAKTVSGMPEKDLESSFANPFGPLVRLHMLGLGAVAGRLTSDGHARGQFSYQNVNTAILGAVLEKVYAQPLSNLLSEKIWHPAGAAAAHWRKFVEDAPVTAYCCLYARARDWIKIATFLARNGRGDGTAFLPQGLWEEFTGTHYSRAQLHEGQYGLHVRHDILDRPGEALQGPFTYLLGRGGQVVYLMPESDLVVVRFGDGAQLLHSTLYATWRTLEAD